MDSFLFFFFFFFGAVTQRNDARDILLQFSCEMIVNRSQRRRNK